MLRTAISTRTGLQAILLLIGLRTFRAAQTEAQARPTLFDLPVPVPGPAPRAQAADLTTIAAAHRLCLAEATARQAHPPATATMTLGGLRAAHRVATRIPLADLRASTSLAAGLTLGVPDPQMACIKRAETQFDAQRAALATPVAIADRPSTPEAAVPPSQATRSSAAEARATPGPRGPRAQAEGSSMETKPCSGTATTAAPR